MWVTANDQHIHVDDMTEDHVRNTLKVILRRAHEGRVWALQPRTGGLRHYTKEALVAKVTVTKQPPKPVDPWAGIESVTLTIEVEEIKALRALINWVSGDTVGQKAVMNIWRALNDAGIPNAGETDQKLLQSQYIEFKR